MEAFGMLKFWRNAAAGADGGESWKAALGTDGEETEDEESFFDLVFKSPDSVAVRGGDEASKKDFQFIESPEDVFMSKNDFLGLKALSPVTPLQSTPKSRDFRLGLSKSSKCEKIEYNGELRVNQLNQFSKSSKIEEHSRFSVKCRVESKETSDLETSSEKSSRDAVRKYLELIKPLYLKVSKRHNDKAKFTEHLTPSSSPVTAPVNLSPNKFSGSRMGSFKIVTKHLQKSRSASAAIDMAPPPARRKDDSLLEQHDGIRGAILHCKKSYISSKGTCVSPQNDLLELSQEKLGPPGPGRNSSKRDATAFE